MKPKQESNKPVRHCRTGKQYKKSGYDGSEDDIDVSD